jgi:S1-C subfamily serine protease/thiol-disulfide isomerase/thioredoxin
MKMRLFRSVLVILAVWPVALGGVAGRCVFSQESGPDYRTWTDNTGKFRLIARFSKLEDGMVHLGTEDRQIVLVPEERLSDADRRLAAKLAEASKNPFAVSSPPPLETVIRRVEGSIVFITTRDHFGAPSGLGSGFVIDRSGLVATNYHVIQNASSAAVKFKNGRELEVAGYVALDEERDLAILQLEQPPTDLHCIEVAVPGNLRQGDRIIAFGHPHGFEFSVSSGIVSAIRRTAEMPDEARDSLGADPDCLWVQISAPLNWGNSGGPLLDAQGRLIGVNTWVVLGQGIGFAVHAKHLADLRKRLPAEPEPFPVPGSFQGPGVTDPIVLNHLANFRSDLADCLQKVFSVADPGKRSEIAKTENPIPEYLDRFRRMIEDELGASTEFQALVTMTRLVHLDATTFATLGATMSDASRDSLVWALSRLQETYVETPSMGGLAFELCSLSTPAVHEFQRAIIAQNPRPDVRGATCLALATSLYRNPQTRGHREQEAIDALELAFSEYGDVQINNVPLKDLAGPELKERKYLSVGRTPQNIIGADSHGREFQLKDYAGKVILLDFWVDWCPYCREMYPHERRLLAKYANQPFEILGVNGDELSRLQHVEASRKVTWRSWADGRLGPISRAWNVRGYPTLFLLDHQGRIRCKGNLRADQLAARIEPLLKEQELKLAFDLVQPCSVWSYLDDGSCPAPNWLAPEYDDSAWKSGRAPLGYGFGDEATTTGFGHNPEQKYVTTYFRKRFTVAARPEGKRLTLNVAFNDGVAVYLNGKEVHRGNLAAAAKPMKTAGDGCSDGGFITRIIKIDSALLQVGENVIAAEVHQHHAGSNDIRFDLSLSSSADE